eukprot:jgi/Orpsp1_1/1192934/evm.model.d7180000097007.1
MCPSTSFNIINTTTTAVPTIVTSSQNEATNDLNNISSASNNNVSSTNNINKSLNNNVNSGINNFNYTSDYSYANTVSINDNNSLSNFQQSRKYRSLPLPSSVNNNYTETINSYMKNKSNTLPHLSVNKSSKSSLKHPIENQHNFLYNSKIFQYDNNLMITNDENKNRISTIHFSSLLQYQQQRQCQENHIVKFILKLYLKKNKRKLIHLIFQKKKWKQRKEKRKSRILKYYVKTLLVKIVIPILNIFKEKL